MSPEAAVKKKTYSRWRSLLIALIAPTIGLIYLRRGALALGYLVLCLCMGLLSLYFAHLEILPWGYEEALTYPIYFTLLICAAHTYFIARQGIAERPIPWYNRWQVATAVTVLYFIGAATFRLYLYEPFHLPSNSMAPNYKQGEYFFVKKFAYRNHLPKRGDVITFNLNPHAVYVKRIIGLPGETIQLQHGTPIINGTSLLQTVHANGTEETLPDGLSHYILIEHPDSPAENTKSITVPAGHYFVLGDNRDNSQDSRFAEIGMISQKAITGKANGIWLKAR